MPEVIDPPIAATPVKPTVIQPGSISGRSFADDFKEKPAKLEPEPKETPDFARSLEAAKAKDNGKAPADEEDAPDVKPVAPDKPAAAPPKVPALPAADEWKPKGEKAAAQWEQMKETHAKVVGETKAELERTRAELAAAKANGSPDTEALKKEVAELREILKDVAIERSPEFKRKYSARESAAVEAAKNAAGDKSNQMEKLLKLPSSQWRDEQIKTLLEDSSEYAKTRVAAALMVLEQIDVERGVEIAERRSSFEHKQVEFGKQQQAQQEQTAKQMKAAFESTLKQWTDPKSGSPFYTEREGDKDHNAGVQESLELAKSIFEGNISVEEKAAAALWAAKGERLLKGWQAERAARIKAEKALDKIRGVQPGEGRTGAAQAEDGERAPNPGDPKFLTYWNAKLAEAKAKDSVTS